MSLLELLGLVGALRMRTFRCIRLLIVDQLLKSSSANRVPDTLRHSYLAADPKLFAAWIRGAENWPQTQPMGLIIRWSRVRAPPHFRAYFFSVRRRQLIDYSSFTRALSR